MKYLSFSHSPILPFFFIFFLGCTQQFHFYKEDTTEREFRVDVYECERDTRMASSGFQRVRPQETTGYYYGADGSISPLHPFSHSPSPWASVADLSETFRERAEINNFYVSCMKARGYVHQ